MENKKTVVIYNYSRLQRKIKEIYGTYIEFSKDLNISNSTLSRKLNGVSSFNQEEILLTCKLLKIPNDKIPDYFFDMIEL